MVYTIVKAKEILRLCGKITQTYLYARYTLMRAMHRLCSCVICSRECTGTLCDTCFAKLMPYTLHNNTHGIDDDIAYATFLTANQIAARTNIAPTHEAYRSLRALPMFATWLYDETIRKLFLAYKKKGVHIISYKCAHAVYATLGKAMRFVQTRRTVNTENIYIVPLPAHPKHEKNLSFSPTGIISRYLAYLLQWNYAPILFRTHSRMQKQLHKSERWQNMHNTLHVKPHAHRAVKHAEVLVLFDDVITTGATMYAAYCKIQKAFPNTLVIGVALSRVKHS